MAKILFTAFMADARGKVAGTVFSKNRSGAYTRTKVTPVNPRTDAQAQQRGQLGVLSSGWRDLTQEQRNAWNAAVADFQRTNVFGNVVKPSGLNLYVGLNRSRLNAGLTTIQAPPSPQGLPDFGLSSVVMGLDSGDLVAEVAPLLELPTDFSALLFMTPPQSAGRNFLRGYVLLNAGAPLPASTPVWDVASLYQDRFGIPPAGAKVGCRIVVVNNATGEASVPLQGSTIVEVLS